MSKPRPKLETATDTELLCRWLHSFGHHNQELSNMLFTQYYNAVARYLVPHIRYKLGEGKANLTEEIFHTVILALCIRLKTERPEAAEQIKQLPLQLSFSDFGQLFDHRVKQWTNNAVIWTQQAMSFPVDYSHLKSPVLDEQAHSLNTGYEPLKEEGGSLVDWLHNQSLDSYTDCIDANLKLLSKMRLPLRGYLYLCADRRIIDYWKKKSTQIEIAFDQDANDDDEHQDIIYGDEEAYKQWIAGHAPDEMEEKEEQLEQAVDYLLAAPIRDAQARLDQAIKKQQLQRAHIQLAKATDEYYENKAIVELLQEGCTQNEIGQQLGLTRDQVAYRLEKIMNLLKPLQTGAKP